MEIYKIYAKCRRTTKSIQEIDQSTAETLIIESVDNMINNGDIAIDEDCDDPGKKIDALGEKAVSFFNENGYFYCGDFAIIKSEVYPERANCYGYTDTILWL